MVLDNPVWHALISGNKHLSEGNKDVKYFPEDISTFAGMAGWGSSSFDMMHATLPEKRIPAIIVSEPVNLPPSWEIVRHIHVLQMVYLRPSAPDVQISGIVPLQERHVPGILALTKLTRPGPFLQRTIAFGKYYGIFDGQKLIAMAGERLHPGNYIEISAVCTHPGYLGKGFAGQLITNQVRQIQSTGCIPFLHVKDDNLPAVKLYEKLGFTIRRPMDIYVTGRGSLSEK